MRAFASAWRLRRLLRRRAGRSTPAGPPAPRSSAASSASACSISVSSRCACALPGSSTAAGGRAAGARRLPFAFGAAFAARLRLALGLRALLAHAHVLGPAADVGVQRPVLDRDRPRADGVEQRAVVRDQQQRARERLQRRLERLAALEVEVVRRLVEDQHVRARLDEHREREPPALAAREPVERLLGLLAAEQEAAEQRARLVRLQPRRALARLQHGPGRAELLGVLA